VPADLDELFGQLGRHADALPLAGADSARRRGRQRTRIRATLTAAAAVVLVVVGVGVTLRQPDRLSAPVTNTTTTPLEGRAIPKVGQPLDLGGKIPFPGVTTDGERVYAVSIKAADRSFQLTAADLESGVPAWTAPQPIVDPRRHLERVVVVPSAVLVVTRANDGTSPAVGLYAFDPLTGAPLWTKDGEKNDSLVFTSAMLVRLAAADGRVDGFDWVSGQERWSRTTGDRPVRALGMSIPDDEAKLSRSGPPQTFGGDTIVLLTNRGDAEVRNAATGDVQRTVPVAPVSGKTAAAYDGWLYTHDEADGTRGPQRIRATDLVGDAGTAVIEELPGLLLTLGACGAARVCVSTQALRNESGDPRINTLTALDARKRRMIWQRNTTLDGDQISSAGGSTFLTSVMGGQELYSPSGKLLHKSTLTGGWLDGRSLLVAAPDGTGRLARVSATDGSLVPYAKHISEFAGDCASTSTRLACADETGLRIWRLDS
jgi:outer membrane protein assembly factor BamB